MSYYLKGDFDLTGLPQELHSVIILLMPSQINLFSKNNTNISDSKIASPIYVISQYAKTILLTFNAILFILYGYRFVLDRDISRINARAEELRGQIAQYEEKALEFDKYQNLADFVLQIEQQDINVPFVLEFLNESTPTGVSIRKIQISEGDLIVHAESHTPAEFSTLLGLLLEEPKFASVILDSSQYDEKEDSFLFSMRMEYIYGIDQ